MPTTHQEHHVFRAERLLLSPLPAGINLESFELLLFLLTNNFLPIAYSIEEQKKRSALIGLLLDMVQRSRVLDLLATQSFATLPLSLQSVLSRLFKEAVQRSELNLVCQLLQVGVDVNQYLPDVTCDSFPIASCRAIEHAVLVYDTALMKILSDFGADSRVGNLELLFLALRRRKTHASASERSITFMLSDWNLGPEGKHWDAFRLGSIFDQIESDAACSASEQIIGFLRIHLRKPASVLKLLVAAVKSNSMFTLDLLSEMRQLLNVSTKQGETP